MSARGRTLVLGGLILGFVLVGATEGHAQGQQGARAAPAPAETAVNVDGHEVSKLSHIEDASLEGLLDLSLEEQLGQTEAVSRTSESILRAPATITTMDATQIRLSGATNVPEVLRFVPGVTVVRSAPGNYVVSLRGTGGLASNNVILLVDGIPVNDPLDGGVSWDLVPLHLQDIERIEVVRGPVSPIYGANAYTGVINIVTRTTIGLSPSYVVRVTGGSDPQGNAAGDLSGRFVHVGKRLELKVFFDAARDGPATVPGSPGMANALAMTPAADRLAATTALTLRISPASSLSLELGGVWSRRSGTDHLALGSERQSQALLFGRALYDLAGLPGGSDVKLWAQGISVGISSPTSPETGFSYDGAHSLRGAAGGDLHVPLGSVLSLQLGGQGSVERVHAPFLHPDANGTVRPGYGVYGGIKATPLERLDLIATARGDLAPISARLEYSYRASAIYHADTWGMRLTGASAFRTPTYVESVGRFRDPATQLILLEGTDSIRSPRNTSVELGATFSPSSRLTVSPTVYVSRLSNLMVEDFESLIRRTFHNSGNPRTFLGAELEANWRVRDGLSVLPSLSLLRWLGADVPVDTNVGVPSQNSRVSGGLRVQGVFGNDRWGYGLGATVASPRQYDVRAGVPPVTISQDLPTTVHVTGVLERQIVQAPSLWGSVRFGASLPGNTAESPLPQAAAMGQSVMLGIELRRE